MNAWFTAVCGVLLVGSQAHVAIANPSRTSCLNGCPDISEPIVVTYRQSSPLLEAPETQVTYRSESSVAIAIDIGDFHFNGVLQRQTSSPNYLVGTDGGIRVIYTESRNLGPDHITIVEQRTGQVYYDYDFFYE